MENTSLTPIVEALDGLSVPLGELARLTPEQVGELVEAGQTFRRLDAALQPAEEEAPADQEPAVTTAVSVAGAYEIGSVKVEAGRAIKKVENQIRAARKVQQPAAQKPVGASRMTRYPEVTCSHCHTTWSPAGRPRPKRCAKCNRPMVYADAPKPPVTMQSVSPPSRPPVSLGSTPLPPAPPDPDAPKVPGVHDEVLKRQAEAAVTGERPRAGFF